MLESTLRIYKNTEISKFGRFLKSKQKNFKPKQSKALEREQIKQFLRETLNEDCILNKVYIYTIV